jgi:hypothetical protein
MSVGFSCNCVILEPLKERQAVHTSSSKDYKGEHTQVSVVVL